MAEQAASDVYAPRSSVQQLWRAVANWFGFFFEILLQILRGTPSCLPHLLSFLGLTHQNHRLLSSSSSSSCSFKPVSASELSLNDSDSSVEDGVAGDSDPGEKLTILIGDDENTVIRIFLILYELNDA
ncbi:hypothetical protein L484_008252 [Morus notabilis]|uniref:Uncharacterized protein n=1 Tax=Morus notabilis TaxID=981085 RepID=W9R6J6_9ROSA|nr:hypothetical protein L484_008252 [Morus notabilis]